MLKLGEYQTLKVLRTTDFGLYLGDGNPENDVLIPNRYVPEGTKEGDDLRVFIYKDSLDRPIATTETPLVSLNQFAALKVKQITKVGAFLDWGLAKELLVPFREQLQEMELGETYVIYLFLDEKTNRLVATSKLNKFFENENLPLKEGDEVEILPYDLTDLGLNVVVNDRYKGLVYANEIFQHIQYGKKMKGYVKKIRDENKLDISLQKQGYLNVIGEFENRIVNALNESEGKLELNDKSSPEDIYAKLSMSKKAFKRAIGALYKKKLILIEKGGITLVG